MWYTKLWKSCQYLSDLSTKGKKRALTRERPFSQHAFVWDAIFVSNQLSLLPYIAMFCDFIICKPHSGPPFDLFAHFSHNYFTQQWSAVAAHAPITLQAKKCFIFYFLFFFCFLLLNKTGKNTKTWRMQALCGRAMPCMDSRWCEVLVEGNEVIHFRRDAVDWEINQAYNRRPQAKGFVCGSFHDKTLALAFNLLFSVFCPCKASVNNGSCIKIQKSCKYESFSFFALSSLFSFFFFSCLQNNPVETSTKKSTFSLQPLLGKDTLLCL